MSSVAEALERFLERAGFDRAPWLAVAFAGGIAAWFLLPTRWHWLALLAGCLATSMSALAAFRGDGRFPYLRQALAVVPLMVMAGCLTVWGKSAIVGERAIAAPVVARITASILEREEQPAEQRVRIILATREPGGDRPIRVRVNLPLVEDGPDLLPGAQVRLRVRLMPPAPPMLPGGYDFARTAWFRGLAATGSALGPVEIVRPGDSRGFLDRWQDALSRHVRERLPDASGGIAMALASGERGAIGDADARAMRDSGLAHLLSISGLHVSALVGAAYVVALRLLALWPWIALRVRLPLVATGFGAIAGVAYTLLSGAEVPTVRSCIGTLLVLAALALGREALSLRLLAVAALFVMLFWPESVIGPSFQMSFVAVLAIIALNSAEPVRRLLAPREEGLAARGLRYLLALLATGVVIELALLPIGLWHFHRAGFYGSLANLVAIPLTTLLTMPLLAIALLLDVAGIGGPAWWLAGRTIDAMLALAHWVSAQPGAVTVRPAMAGWTMVLFLAGGLWLALWRGRVRLLGLAPVTFGVIALAGNTAPDILVSGDGHHVGITGESEGELLVLRDSRSDFARDNLTELAGMNGAVRTLADWPGARCSRDFCTIELDRAGRTWRLLISRSHDRVPERELAAACDRSDIVISERWLPRSCRPAWLRADRRLLERTGGLAIDLARRHVATVAATQGSHGWWRGGMHDANALRRTGGRERGPSGGVVGGKPEAAERVQAPVTGNSAPAGTTDTAGFADEIPPGPAGADGTRRDQ